MMGLDAFLIAAKRSSREAFVQRFPGQFLLVQPFATPAEPSFRTVGASEVVGTSTALVPIEKRRGANTFDWMITIGRAPNNDIVIPASDVSKFHAMIRDEGDGAWSLVDANSTFGTTLEGKKLVGQQPVPLRPGSEITMGSVAMWFHTSSSLYDALRDQDL